MTNCHHDLLFGSSSNHEEGDARMLLHAKDVSDSHRRYRRCHYCFWNVFEIKSEWITAIVWDMKKLQQHSCLFTFRVCPYASIPCIYGFWPSIIFRRQRKNKSMEYLELI